MTRPAPIAIWLSAARPKTLPAAVAPVVIATAMAWQAGQVAWAAFACALLGAVLIQIGTNFANDYADHARGADTADRKGPTRATAAGWVTPGQMKAAAAIAYALVLLPGIYILYRGGWPYAVIGVAGILAGIAYSSGPYPLAYTGLADLAVLVFFGPVAVAGTYYLHTLAWAWDPVIAGLAPGLIAVALLTVNNLRDIDEDRAAGRKTLPVRFGRTFARVEYAACLVIGCVAVPLYFYATTGFRWFAAAPLSLAVVGPGVRSLLAVSEARALNHLLARTGGLLLIFSLVFAIGWILR